MIMITEKQSKYILQILITFIKVEETSECVPNINYGKY